MTQFFFLDSVLDKIKENSPHRKKVDDFKKYYYNNFSSIKEPNEWVHLDREHDDRDDFKLGEGDYGFVYLGYKHEHAEWVAIKEAKADTKEEKEALDKEIKMMADLCLSGEKYPSSTVPLISHSKGKRDYFIVVSLCDYSLDKYLEELSKSDSVDKHKFCCSVIEQMMNGIELLHRKEIFHRDLKPQNVMINVNNGKPTVRLIDFGISVFSGKFSSRSTKRGGHPSWVHPTVLSAHFPQVIPADDIFSAVLLTAYILTFGKHPILPDISEKCEKSSITNEIKLRTDIDLQPEFKEFFEECFKNFENFYFKRQVANHNNKVIFKECFQIDDGNLVSWYRTKLDTIYWFKHSTSTFGKRYSLVLPYSVREKDDKTVDQVVSNAVSFINALKQCHFTNIPTTKDTPREELQKSIKNFLKKKSAKSDCDYYVGVYIITHGSSNGIESFINMKTKKGEIDVNVNTLLEELRNVFQEFTKNPVHVFAAVECCRSETSKTLSKITLCKNNLPEKTAIIYSSMLGTYSYIDSKELTPSQFTDDLCSNLIVGSKLCESLDSTKKKLRLPMLSKLQHDIYLSCGITITELSNVFLRESIIFEQAIQNESGTKAPEDIAETCCKILEKLIVLCDTLFVKELKSYCQVHGEVFLKTR